MAKLPKFLKQYFWDVDFEKIDPEKKPRYVIARILEWGDQEATRWLFQNYDREIIGDVAKQSRELSKRSINFWLTILGLERWKKEALARKQNAIWNY